MRLNRSSPKTQSALLEAMQEKRVTVMGETHTLPSPFCVIATQNPIEMEGTYPLPEAQLDRFLFKLGGKSTQQKTLENIALTKRIDQPESSGIVVTKDEMMDIFDLVKQVHLPQFTASFIARLVDTTHKNDSEISSDIEHGCSPRAVIALASAGRARAILDGRAYVSIDDIREIAIPVMAHRIIIDYRSKMEGKSNASVLKSILDAIPDEDNSLPTSLQEAKIK